MNNLFRHNFNLPAGYLCKLAEKYLTKSAKNPKILQRQR